MAKCKASLWLLICTIHLTAWSDHVTYVSSCESTLYSCLTVKELLARNRHIWNLSDCNGTGTQNHLVCKGTRNHLAKLVKWLSCIMNLSVPCIWLHGRIMSRTRFKVNPHSIVVWMLLQQVTASHLNFRYHACFEQYVPRHSGNYRVWIHFKTHTLLGTTRFVF